MCGIAGIVDKSGQEISESILKKMTDAVAHRGPDGEGFFLENNIGLGHRRLSIIDLSNAGKQPMEYAGKYVITYNGEIFNYLELREQLKKEGCVFATATDTEVILAAYHKWGKTCVNRFNGMWAFALYDREKNLLFCSRDRFGIKPFHYINHEKEFVFSSEIRQLTCFLSNVKVEMKTLLNYLALGLEDTDEFTFFEGVKKLPAGHNLFLDTRTGNFSVEQYYFLEKEIEKKSVSATVSIFRSALEQAVSLRLRSDVKVGTCLSGGMDSSAVAAIASRFYALNSSSKFIAITAKSSDSRNDETYFACMVAEKHKLDWRITEPGLDDFFSTADKVIEIQEEPFGSPSVIMQYFVMKTAKETGTIVLLDGQGGDETLLGYPRYYPAYLISLPFAEKISGFFRSSQNSGLSPFRLLLYYLYFTSPVLQKLKSRNNLPFIKNEYFSLLNSGLLKKLSLAYSDVRQLQITEIIITQLAHLLRYEDRNSMHFSVEARLPFLDHNLLELSLSLPSEMKINKGWTKYILRKSVEDILPHEIVWRKNKIGFEAPVSQWLRDKKNFEEEINCSELIRKISKGKISFNQNDTLWRFYNVARWEKIFNVHVA